MADATDDPADRAEMADSLSLAFLSAGASEQGDQAPHEVVSHLRCK
jgi:hypothetical protein